jgi:hypothetical protein
MIPSNSEQRQPFYIGLNPRQLSLKSSPASIPSHPELPNVLKTHGEYFLHEMVKVVRTEAKTSSPIWFEVSPLPLPLPLPLSPFPPSSSPNLTTASSLLFLFSISSPLHSFSGLFSYPLFEFRSSLLSSPFPFILLLSPLLCPLIFLLVDVPRN